MSSLRDGKLTCAHVIQTFEMVIVAESVPVEGCFQVKCRECGKATWAVSAAITWLTIADSFQGCGQHIAQVRQVLCHLKDGLTYSASGVARCERR